MPDAPDTRTKEQLKADGDYTSEYWRKLKLERGWTLPTDRRKSPKKKGQSKGAK